MTTDRISKVDAIFKAITDLLPMIYDGEVNDEFKESHFIVDSNRDEILSTEENEVEAIANWAIISTAEIIIRKKMPFPKQAGISIHGNGNHIVIDSIIVL